MLDVRSRKNSCLTSLYALLATLTLAFVTGETQAESFPLPVAGDDMIGQLRHTRARHEDTLIDIARRFSVGQDEMVMANPTVDRWLPKEGTNVVIPQEYILPDAPRSGIVVNIPEMRLYYFPVRYEPPKPKPRKPVAAQAGPKAQGKAGAGTKAAAANNAKTAGQKPGAKAGAKPGDKAGKTAASRAGAQAVAAKPKAPAPAPAPAPADQGEVVSISGEVISYPVSMGRMDWRTPIGKTTVVFKQKDPSWTPPASIKKEHAAKGDPLPDVVPPGPDNPLGKYAMRLGVAGYLIHGTDAPKSDGIGMRVTHGCMRMYNEDIEKLFPLVPVGSPVYLVNQPVKAGWKGQRLYIELSQPLDEDVGIPPHDVDDDISKAEMQREDAKRASFLLNLAREVLEKHRARGDVSIDMDRVREAVKKPSGLPVLVGGIGSEWRNGLQDEEPAPASASPAVKPIEPEAPYRPARPAVPPAPIRVEEEYEQMDAAPVRTAPYGEGAASEPNAYDHGTEAPAEGFYTPDNPYPAEGEGQAGGARTTPLDGEAEEE